jgi:hypothetical protein
MVSISQNFLELKKMLRFVENAFEDTIGWNKSFFKDQTQI